MAVDFKTDDIQWAMPQAPPGDSANFVGRAELLKDCRAAWKLDDEYRFINDDSPVLHFRLEGPPGIGKNELVYEIVRQIQKSAADNPPGFFMLAGHEDMTPEDLSVLLAPGPDEKRPVVLRASPLATAIKTGGIFFFDEINRVPQRALSPLAEVLDIRTSITSAMTGLPPIRPGADVAKRFRFCCALNPELGYEYVLPDYIDQRTLPVFEVLNPSKADLLLIIERKLGASSVWQDAFGRLYDRQAEVRKISVRQAVSFVAYAMRLEPQTQEGPASVLERVVGSFLRSKPASGAPHDVGAM
jgi:hypothetical protein